MSERSHRASFCRVAFTEICRILSKSRRLHVISRTRRATIRARGSSYEEARGIVFGVVDGRRGGARRLLR